MTKEERKEYNRLYRLKNINKLNEYDNINKSKRQARRKKYYQDNKERLTEYNNEFKKSNKEYYKEYDKNWHKNNPHYSAKRNAKRRAMKLEATPEDANPNIIKTFYEMSNRLTKCLRIPFHVDHLIPLIKGGLHHENNLLPVPASVNLSKHGNLDFSHPFYQHLYFTIK